MARLHTAPNIAHPDDLYQSLIELHEGLDDAQSALVNAKLVMFLVNHIGDEEVVLEAIAMSRKDARSGETRSPQSREIGRKDRSLRDTTCPG